jgi:UPF0271 protein
MEIDLNVDLGEGCRHDRELLALVTSANIACGFHAGDPALIAATLAGAREHGVQVGAHPGYNDRANFGRREMERSEAEIFQDCCYQIGALAGMARAAGLALAHVKPHGALYNQAARDDRFARPIVEAAALFGLTLVGLPGSRLEALAADRCRFVAEGFADRRYLPDGQLVPRTQHGAMIEHPAEAVNQVRRLIAEKGIQTVCVHGDNPRAVEFVKALRQGLAQAGFTVAPFGRG